MPKFDFNPAQVDAGFLKCLPKDYYELKITGLKSFISKKTNSDTGADESNYGVRVMAEVVEGDEAGQKVILNMYQHSEGSRKFCKPFQMAVYGYETNSESQADFDLMAASLSWGFDTDTGAVDDGWANMKGKRVKGFAEIQISASGRESNNWGQWVRV